MRFGKLVILVLLSVAMLGCKEELYSGLRENEVNEMVSILLREGISSEKKKDLKNNTYSVMVDGSQFHSAIELLKNSGYPKETFLKVNELFKNDGLVSSPLEERIRYIYAIAQEVQETLSRIDGVVTARVHVVLPENDPFVDKVKPSSASVFIKYLPDRYLDDIKSEIKQIVEKSIEGLSYEKVSVIMLPADESATSAKSTSDWTNLWGIRVSADSVTRLRFVVWTLIATIALLGVLLLLTAKELVSSRRRRDTPASAAADGATESAPLEMNLIDRFMALIGLRPRNG